jgi:hypothetical protein
MVSWFRKHFYHQQIAFPRARMPFVKRNALIDRKSIIIDIENKTDRYKQSKITNEG